MKHIPIITTFTAILLIVSCGQNKQITTGLEGKPIPSINLLMIDSTTKINTANLKDNEPVVFFFFSPQCPYCKLQTEDIISNIKSLNNIHFYLVSSFPFRTLKQYYRQYELERYSNITVGRDYDYHFVDYYSVKSIPYIAVFNKDKILKKVFVGKTDINVIKSTALN